MDPEHPNHVTSVSLHAPAYTPPPPHTQAMSHQMVLEAHQLVSESPRHLSPQLLCRLATHLAAKLINHCKEQVLGVDEPGTLRGRVYETGTHMPARKGGGSRECMSRGGRGGEGMCMFRGQVGGEGMIRGGGGARCFLYLLHSPPCCALQAGIHWLPWHPPPGPHHPGAWMSWPAHTNSLDGRVRGVP